MNQHEPLRLDTYWFCRDFYSRRLLDDSVIYSQALNLTKYRASAWESPLIFDLAFPSTPVNGHHISGMLF
jgi:hypothetical protein